MPQTLGRGNEREKERESTGWPKRPGGQEHQEVKRAMSPEWLGCRRKSSWRDGSEARELERLRVEGGVRSSEDPGPGKRSTLLC